MNDPTETIRHQRMTELNSNAGNREALESKHGQVWDTSELQKEFEVIGFMAPFVAVRRKEDGVTGSVEFQASPRFYFNFQQ